MLKKITSVVILSILICSKIFSQDSPKYLYKISSSDAKVSAARHCEPANVLMKKKSVYSCDVNSKINSVIISYKAKNGSIIEETYELKKEKK